MKTSKNKDVTVTFSFTEFTITIFQEPSTYLTEDWFLQIYKKKQFFLTILVFKDQS